MDTAALVAALDLVIAVDTAVVHLAGALGKEVWLLNRFESEWRWGHGSTRSVWYPTMTVFNQRQAGRWDDVIGNVAKRLGDASSTSEPMAGYVPQRPSERPHGDFETLLHSASQSLEQGDLLEAESCFRDAIKVRNDSARAWDGLGVSLALQDRHVEAREALERAGKLEDQGRERCDSFINLANSLASDGLVQDALAVYRKELPRRPSPQGHHNYALTLLSAGKLIEGWRHYEFRWMIEPLLSLHPRYQQPQWAGQDLRGKTILVHCEQGLGDTLQFVRYASSLKALGARVVLLVQTELMRLARGFSGVDLVIDAVAEMSLDYYVPLLSLPRVFGTDLSSIPAEIPYLTVEPERRDQWAARFAGDGRLRVGVVWAGSRGHARDRSRSMPPSALKGIFEVAHVRFFSLQKPVDGDIADVKSAGVTDLAPHLDDFADTAAAVSHMDLVLCVDTSVAHLAGALGKTIWLMVPREADARWLAERDDSPWYPKLRLFRQRRRNDWTDVVAQVRAELEAWVSKESAVTASDGFRTGTAKRALVPCRDLSSLNAGHRMGLTAVAATRTGTLQYLPDEPIVGDSIGWYGEYLQPQLDLLRRMVHPGAVVAEIGAGLGAHAVFLSRALGGAGHLFLDEPRPVMQRILRQNFAVNSVTNVTLLWSEHEKRGDERTTVIGGTAHALDSVALERLDCLKAGFGTDALEMLAGATETLWRLRPSLFLAAPGQQALERVRERICDFGYRCWRMEIPLFNPENFNRRELDIFEGRTTLALIAVPEEKETDLALDEVSGISEL
jgi:hypothetical protein